MLDTGLKCGSNGGNGAYDAFMMDATSTVIKLVK